MTDFAVDFVLNFLSSQLREELGRVPLPLLIVFAVAITLVILLFAHWNSRNLREQERDKGWARVRHGQDTQLAAHTTQSQSYLHWVCHKGASCQSCDASPESRLAEIIGILTDINC